MPHDDFTLEKLKISERLTALETRFENNTGMLQDIHKTIVGHNGTPGMKIELDRLKQKDMQKEKHGMVLYASVVGLFLKEVWHWIIK